MSKTPNLRFELRAYEDTDCCRLANFILGLTTEPPLPVKRDQVISLWREGYPRHAEITGRRSVPRRVGDALWTLKVAEIARVIDHEIEVVNLEYLQMSAGNLAIVEDAEGVAVPPGRWTERPVVPPHLLATQRILEQSGPQPQI